MPEPNHRHRRLVQGSAYTATPEVPAEPSAAHPSGRLAHLTASPEELGLIGAELAKRLTLAAEDFLSELAADQVRGSFRQELGDFAADQSESET